MSNTLENLSPKERRLYEMLREEKQRNKSAGIPQTIQRRKETITGLPLSFAQQRLWFLDQLEPGNPAYNLSFARHLKGELNQEALQQSLDEIVRRHEILRTTFAAPEGRAAQLLGPPQSLPITRHDFSTISADRQAGELRRRLNQQAQLPFRLDRWPLLRVNLIRLGPNEHVLQLVMHHIISDGWSMQVLIQELSSLYAAYSKSEQSPLIELPMQYSDYALWQREWLTGGVLEEQLQYWRGQLGDATAAVLELPTDRARPAEMSHRGRREAIVLGAELTQGLRALSRHYGVTLFMTLLAGFQALLWRYSRAETVVVGVPIAGRSRVELEGLVGFFANTLALRVAVRGEQTFEELLQAVQGVCLGAFQHQEIPFEKVVEELHPQRQLNRNPLFQVMFIFQTDAQEKLVLPGLEISGLDLENETAIFDLSLTAVEEENNLRMLLQYSTDLFEAETIKRTLNYLERLLEGVVANPQQRVSELPLLAEVERQQILVEWNRTEKKFESENRCIHELFERQVEKTPDASALIFEGQQLSYRELNCRVNSLAHYLRRLGVGPEVLVGLYLERSVEMVVALLAVLKAGGGYVPLDSEYPRDRLAFVLDDVGVRVLLTQAGMVESLPECRAEVICLDAEVQLQKLQAEREENLQSEVVEDNVAYVIYTSGSTGKPKGVVVTHSHVIRLFGTTHSWFNFGAEDVWTLFHSYAFDFSVWELWGALLYGGRLVVVPYMVSRSPEAFHDLLSVEKVTVLNQTPSAFRQLMRVDESDASRNLALRLVIFGGEALDIAGLKPWFERHGDRQPQLVNMYGITETTVHVTYRPLIKEDALYNASLIGVPIPDLQLYILDEHLQPVPFDMQGEIYIGGAGVARGYLNRPELTAERFIPNPFGNCPGSRLYKTGDAARRLSKGDIEYLGRTDLQVKIRGFRIELGEIEVALLDHPQVLDALVIARDSGEHVKQLIAYIIPDPQSVPTVIELRNSLKKKLPDYMLPAHFVMLDAFPLTVNGKVDRLALPAPEVSRSELSREYAVAQTVSEELLVAIWSEILRVERIGVHDNFFELGGDSILSIQIIARANQAGLRLTPRQLFEHQTIAELAAVAGTTGAITAEQGRVSGAIPLTPIQHWFFSQQLNAPHHFNQSLLLSLRQPVSASVLEQAVTALVDHHDALRLRYRRTEQGWEQFNAAAESNPIFSEVDLSDLPADEQALAIEAHAGEMQASLELEHGPLLKVVYFDLGVERGRRLLIIIHHLAVDGVSWRILLEDLVLGCEQARVGKLISFSPKTTSFKQWAEQLQKYATSAEVAEQASYWLEIAARSQSVRPLPVELQGKNNKVSAARSLSVSLSAEETQALLQEVPDVYQTRIQEVLLAALLETLSEWSGDRRVLIEVEGHGREEIGSELDVTRTVGWFTTQYPVVLEKQEGSKTGEILKQVKEQVRGVPKRGTGYGLLKYMSNEASVREEMRRGSEAQVSFNYLGQFDQVLNQGALFELANGSVGPVVSPKENRPHLLEINGSVVSGRLRLGWGYSEELHRRETIEQLAEAFKENLQKLIAHCRSPEARGHTASDFPLVQFDQAVLQEFERSNEKIEDIYPLSPLQLGLFFLKRFAPDSEEYFNQFSFRLHGPLDTEALAGAWQRVVQRHQVLRSGFHWEGLEQPVQVVHREVKIFLEQLDWRKLSPAEQQEQLGPFLIADRQRGMNFSEPPLMRLTLIRLADESYQFIWSHHHILLDGWSLFRVLNEALAIYEALLRGEELQLERPRPYQNYIAWLQQQDMKKAEQFWSETLKGFSGPAPVMLEEGSGETETESRHAEHQITLPAETHAALKASARAQRVTVNTMLQGAWALLLSHYSGAPDVVFGGVVSGRPSELSGAENMVGLFINTLPVRVQIVPDQQVMSWLQQLQERQSIARQYDYSSLADVQRWSEVKRGEVLFESVYAFENYPIDAALREHKGSLEVSENRLFERIHYPLNLIVKPNQELVLQIWYDSQRFSSAAIKRMSEKLESILAAFVANPEQKLKQVSLLTEAEHKALATARTTTAESETLPVIAQSSPATVCLHHLFEQQAARNPQAVALVFEGRPVTYAELNRRANQLAHYLRGLGVRAEVPVGMLMKRSVEMIVGVLGILKAGGAYVPLDPEYPKERLAFMLDDSRAALVLTQKDLAQGVREHGVQVVALDTDWKQIARESEENPSSGATPANAAYVIFTSGSTGKPKGVLCTHQNVLRLLEHTQAWYGFTEQDVWTLFHSYAFDFSVWEIWGALVYGGRLVVVPYLVSRSPEAFYKLLVAERVTVLNQTPSAFNQLIGADKAQNPAPELSLRLIIFGGETLNLQSLKGWFERYGDERPKLINMYGITETTVFVTYRPVSSAHLTITRDVIGRPINDLQVHILNEELQRVPIGVSGEMYVGGAGLARGYVNRPELTAERFIPDPFSREPGARLYKTGDLGRYLDQLNIEYLGRIDRQVKIRGHRIELGEIESVLSHCPGVQQAVIAVREDAPGDQRLVAYIVPEEGFTLALDQLQRFAKKELPAYMVPATMVLMKTLPLTSSGKVDYRALPPPDLQAQQASTDLVLPRNELEKQIAAIWQKVLGLERVGVHDNFYDLGGHSILMAQVFNEVCEIARQEVTMVELFEHPTISGLARHLSREQGAAAAATAGTPQAQMEKQREGKDRLRQQFRQRQRGRRG